MKIQTLNLFSYEIALSHGQQRTGVLIEIRDDKGKSGWGDIAPLAKWSKETLEEAVDALNEIKQKILQIAWTEQNSLDELAGLQLPPSTSFGFESAVLSILSPISEFKIQTSALLMGSPIEILEQARLRELEGYISAKLKVSNLSFNDAYFLIDELKNKFRLRIDVNRAWSTDDSLRFFSRFPLDAFDYVEEPFRDPSDLGKFLHPLAVDESFLNPLSLKELESFSTLRALIYKPTLQGGMMNCRPLYAWTKEKGIAFVLSSSFESDLGVACIASMAHRLSLSSPVGIGTFHFLKNQLLTIPLQFSNGRVGISTINGRIKQLV